MSPKILLVNPPIYDFSAYDFWLKPYGLLRVGGYMRGQAELRLFDYLDRWHPLAPPVAHEQDMDLPERGVAVRASEWPGVDVGWLGDRPGIPVRALDRPGDDMLEAAERRPPLTCRLVDAEAVVRVERVPAPAAAVCHT